MSQRNNLFSNEELALLHDCFTSLLRAVSGAWLEFPSPMVLGQGQVLAEERVLTQEQITLLRLQIEAAELCLETIKGLLPEPAPTPPSLLDQIL